MKIAQVTPFYHPRRGGVETVVKEYSERLVKKGHEVHVYTLDGSVRTPWVEDINGVKVHRSIRIPLPFLKPLSPAFLFPFKLLRADVDLIHVHANKYFSTDAGALIARLKGTPLVYSPHAGTFGKTFVGRIHNQTIGRIALSADVIICVSEHEKSLIKASGVKVKHFEVVPNGVGIGSFALKKKSEAPAQRSPMILYVGRLSPHKGLDTLMAAAPLVLEKLPEVRFVIAGPNGSSKFNPEAEQARYGAGVQSSKLGDRVTFLGEVSEEEKVVLMQKASVFVLPSRSEAFGITVIEAMAAGCPVVVSDLPALTEIVEHEKTGLVFPVDDEEMLADRIIKLLSDRTLSQEISENARIIVKEKYDWEKIIERLENIYVRLL